MTTALITGAAGFVARHLVNSLRASGSWTLIGVDVRDLPLGLFETAIVADLADKAATNRVVETARPDLIFHLAGIAKGPDEAIYSSNVESTRNLIECIRTAAYGARIVVVGSAAEYGVVPVDQQPVRETFEGMPRSAYGRAKAEVSRLGRHAASDYGLHVVVARPFNIIGPGISAALMVGAVVERLRLALASPPPRILRIGSTTAIRDFISVGDVADGLLRAGQRGRPGEAYNLCSGIGRTVAEVVDYLVGLAGGSIEIEHDPQLVVDGEVDTLVGSRQKAESELGWTPLTSLEASLRAAWDAKSLRSLPSPV